MIVDPAEYDGAPGLTAVTALVDAAPVGAAITDGSGMIRHVNRQFRELTGTLGRKLRGKPLVLYLCERDRPVLRRLLSELAKATAAADPEVETATAAADAEVETVTGVVVRMRVAGDDCLHGCGSVVVLLSGTTTLAQAVEPHLVRAAARLGVVPPSPDLAGTLRQAAGIVLRAVPDAAAVTVVPPGGELPDGITVADESRGPVEALIEIPIREGAAPPGQLILGMTRASAQLPMGLDVLAQGFGGLVQQQTRLAALNEAARRSADEIRNLRAAIDAHAVVNQAVGITMAQLNCTADEAMKLLLRASQDGNRKLRDVAVEIVARVSTTPAR